MDEFPALFKLTHDEKDELIRSLLVWVERLTARVAQLEARLSQDSHNSSKPPSSDGYTKKSRSLRENSATGPSLASAYLFACRTFFRIQGNWLRVQHPGINGVRLEFPTTDQIENRI